MSLGPIPTSICTTLEILPVLFKLNTYEISSDIVRVGIEDFVLENVSHFDIEISSKRSYGILCFSNMIKSWFLAHYE